MLDTVFPRIPGDFGNAVTWPFPVLYRVVRGASPDRVVRHRAEGLLDAFIDTGKALVADGADGLSTTCGFLSLFQEELAQAVNVPVASSSLMQVPLVQKLLPPDQQVGVITISRESLTAEHLLAAGAPQDTPIVGTENGREFTRVILEDERRCLSPESARRGGGTGSKTSKGWCDCAGVCQHGPPRRGSSSATQPADIQHCHFCQLVSVWPAAASLQQHHRRPPLNINSAWITFTASRTSPMP